MEDFHREAITSGAAFNTRTQYEEMSEYIEQKLSYLNVAFGDDWASRTAGQIADAYRNYDEIRYKADIDTGLLQVTPSWTLDAFKLLLGMAVEQIRAIKGNDKT